MKKILISLLLFGWCFAQSGLSVIDGQVKFQNKAFRDLIPEGSYKTGNGRDCNHYFLITTGLS